MTQPHPQPTEYIITMARIIKVRNMLMVDGYKNADVLDRMVNLLRSRTHTPAAPAMDALADLEITASMLYEFCEWFCDHNCEEKPCNVTVSRLHERLEGIKKQIGEHPEYLVKWNARRAEQKALLRGGGAP